MGSARWKISNVWGKSAQVKRLARLLVFCVLVAIYVLFFPLLHQTFGWISVAFSWCFIGVAIWFWGLRGGVLAALSGYFLNLVLLESIGAVPLGSFVSPIVSISAAAVLGWLRDLSVRLREQLSERKKAEEALRNAQDALEHRVSERTTDLQAANEQLRREITERKRTEEALRESEEKWRSFTNNTNDIIQILDTEGKILYMNKVYPPHNLEDVIGRSVLEFMDGESKEITKKSIENLLRDKIPQDCEVKILLTESGSSLFEVKFVPHFLNEEVDKIIAHVSNIDERKQAEEALKESEVRYRELV